MAIASVGTLGTAASSTSASSFTLSTATNTLAAGNFGILTVVSDNRSTTDGFSNDHVSVSGGTGTWYKIGEYTNTVGGVAGDGVCVSTWYFEATGSVPTATTITITLSGAITDKCASFWKFTKAANTKLGVSASAIGTTLDAAAGFGSAAFSGLPSSNRLYFRGLGKEANSTTALTVSTGFSQITNTRSRNNTSAVSVWGEFRINTSAGETSNPTLAVTGDAVGIFAALYELPNAPNSSQLTDNFNDNSMDTSKWVKDLIWANGASQTIGGGTAIEQNNRVELSNAGGTQSGNGYTSANTYVIDEVFITPSNLGVVSGNGAFLFTIGQDQNNLFKFLVTSTVLLFERRSNGISTTVGTWTYNANSHARWRITWDGATIRVYTAASTSADPPSPTGGEWVQMASSANDPGIWLHAARIGFAYNSSDISKSTVYVDGFNTSTDTRPNASTIVDNFDDNALDSTTFKTAAWAGQTGGGGGFWPQGGTVIEQNQRIEISPDPAGASFNSLLTNSYVSVRDNRFFVKVTPSSDVPIIQSWSVSFGTDDSFNLWRATYNNGSLSLQHLYNGGFNGNVSAAWTAAQSGWIALWHDTVNDVINVDTYSGVNDPPQPADWTNLLSLPFNGGGPTDACKIGFTAGASGSNPNAVPVYFDGFNGATFAAVVGRRPTTRAYIVG